MRKTLYVRPIPGRHGKRPWWRDQARSKEAQELLASVYDRFTEGFATNDLKAATALLDDLSER
jgi:hypothetical protein